MNKVHIVGRLTKDPEISVTSDQTPRAKFTVAVDRRFKDAAGNKLTDFIPCVAWKQTAQFVSNYFKKGQRIGLSGSVQTRKYDNNGQTVFVVEIVADEVEFVDSKTETSAAPNPPPAPPAPTTVSVAPPQLPKPEQVTIEQMQKYGELPFDL